MLTTIISGSVPNIIIIIVKLLLSIVEKGQQNMNEGVTSSYY